MQRPLALMAIGNFSGLQVPYLVTAAHCADTQQHRTGGDFANATHSPSFITDIQMDSGGTDAQAMTHGTSSNPNWQPTSSVEGWQVSDSTLTSTVPLNGVGDRVGDTVCHAGASTMGNNNCGPIHSRLFACGGLHDACC